MDVPSLPPLPLPYGRDSNNNAVPFLVRQYVIKGVQDLPQELGSRVIMFYEELITLMEGALESWQLITKEKYTTILTAMIHIHDGEPVKLLRSIYPQIYKWYKKYALVASDDSFVIVARPYNAYGYVDIDKNVTVDWGKDRTQIRIHTVLDMHWQIPQGGGETGTDRPCIGIEGILVE
jgi:hypothetical protein